MSQSPFTQSVVTPNTVALIGQSSQNLNEAAQRQLQEGLAAQASGDAEKDRQLQLQLAEEQGQQYQNLNASRERMQSQELMAREKEMEKQREFEKSQIEERKRLDIEFKKLELEVERAKVTGQRELIGAAKKQQDEILRQQMEIDQKMGALDHTQRLLTGQINAIDIKGMDDFVKQQETAYTAMENTAKEAANSAVEQAVAHISVLKDKGEFDGDKAMSTAGKIDNWRARNFPFVYSVLEGSPDENLGAQEQAAAKAARPRNAAMAMGDAIISNIDSEAFAGKATAAFKEFMSAAFEQSFVRSSGGEGDIKKIEELAAKAKEEMGEDVFARVAWAVADQIDSRVQNIGKGDSGEVPTESGNKLVNNALRNLSLTDNVLNMAGVKKSTPQSLRQAREIHDMGMAALMELDPVKFAEIAGKEIEGLNEEETENYRKMISNAQKRLGEWRAKEDEREALKAKQRDLLMQGQSGITSFFESYQPDYLDTAIEGLDSL